MQDFDRQAVRFHIAQDADRSQFNVVFDSSKTRRQCAGELANGILPTLLRISRDTAQARPFFIDGLQFDQANRAGDIAPRDCTVAELVQGGAMQSESRSRSMTMSRLQYLCVSGCLRIPQLSRPIIATILFVMSVITAIICHRHHHVPRSSIATIITQPSVGSGLLLSGARCPLDWWA